MSGKIRINPYDAEAADSDNGNNRRKRGASESAELPHQNIHDSAKEICTANENKPFISKGNGRLDAVSNALKALFGVEYVLTGYEQHALSDRSDSKAISYVGVETDKGTFFGAGVDDDIIKSSYKALTSAVNNLLSHK